MVRILLTDRSGNEVTIPARSGATLMEAIVAIGVDGIDAECGGSCACATCHVYVDDKWHDEIEAAKEYECELLEALDNRTDSSRLSCQVRLTNELDGLKITVPPAPERTSGS